MGTGSQSSNPTPAMSVSLTKPAPLGFWQFLAGIFSEADGTPSYSRICSALCTAAAVLLLVIKALKTGQVPSGPEVAEYLAGANAAYLANKINGLLRPPAGGGK